MRAWILRRKRRGNNAIEFALILGPMLMFIFGSMDYGWYFGLRHTLHNACYEGARAGSMTAMPGDGGDPLGVAENVAAATWLSTGIPAAAEFDADALTVNGEAVLRVTGTIENHTLVGYVPMPTDDIEIAVTKRMESQ